MHAPQLSQLQWLRPRNMEARAFAELRPHLADILTNPNATEVYSVNTRSIYSVNHATLGSIAVKELRFETTLKRYQAATLRRHRVLCEFYAAACFAKRGGSTPKLYCAATEGRRTSVRRVFIIMEWLRNASTLSESIQSWSQDVLQENINELANTLVHAAHCGLVHGRHSSENILVRAPLKFDVIDFSHAQLFATFHAPGFVHDVARIAARLMIEKACSKETVMTLFRAVVGVASRRDVTLDLLVKQFDNISCHSKRRQRIARNYRTFWRGFPSRLRA